MNVYTVVPSIACLHAGVAYMKHSPVGVKGALVLSLSTSTVYLILTSAYNRFLDPAKFESSSEKAAETTHLIAKMMLDTILVGVIFVSSCKLSGIVGYPIDYKTALKLHGGAVAVALGIATALGTVGLVFSLVIKNRIERKDKELEQEHAAIRKEVGFDS